MAGPGDERAAAEGRGRGDLRASHTDREQVIGTLKAAFVQGMLAKDEFDQRVGQAFASRNHAELAALTADLSVKPIVTQSPKLVRAQGEQPVLRPGPVLAVATGLYAGVWAFTFLPPWPTDSEGDPPRAIILLVFSTTIIYLLVLAIAVGNMLASRQEKRSGGQSAPGAGGQASSRPPSVGDGGQSRRPARASSTPPKQLEAILPLRVRPSRGQRINSAVADTATRSAMPAIDPSFPAGPSAGPPRPGAPTTPNPPATRSEPGCSRRCGTRRVCQDEPHAFRPRESRSGRGSGRGQRL